MTSGAAVRKSNKKRNGSVPTTRRTQSKAIRSSRRSDKTVIVVGLLQLSPGDNYLGNDTYTKINRSLQELTLPEKSNAVIDLWLESPGGSASYAYKIALLLRSIASHIRVVIPDYAKSAATLLSLVADEIFMGPAAELGPLDAQVGYEKNPGMRVSALDRTRNLNEIIEAARDVVLGLGYEVRSRTSLGTADTVTAMSDLASKLFQPLVAQVDPTILHRSNRILQEAVVYGKRLMLTRQNCPRELAEALPDRLTKDYPTHGYLISLEEAAELGLPVRPMHEYEYAANVTNYYDELQASKKSLVDVINVIPSNDGIACNGESDSDASGSPAEADRVD